MIEVPFYDEMRKEEIKQLKETTKLYTKILRDYISTYLKQQYFSQCTDLQQWNRLCYIRSEAMQKECLAKVTEILAQIKSKSLKQVLLNVGPYFNFDWGVHMQIATEFDTQFLGAKTIIHSSVGYRSDKYGNLKVNTSYQIDIKQECFSSRF